MPPRPPRQPPAIPGGNSSGASGIDGSGTSGSDPVAAPRDDALEVMDVEDLDEVHDLDIVEEDDDERREHSRYEVTAYVDYAGSEILLYHHIENISLGGICIRTTMLEELGTKVELVINFPDLDKTIATLAEVVWVNPKEPMDMGLRFLDLDEERVAVLRQYIETQRRRR